MRVAMAQPDRCRSRYEACNFQICRLGNQPESGRGILLNLATRSGDVLAGPVDRVAGSNAHSQSGSSEQQQHQSFNHIVLGFRCLRLV